MDIKIFFGLVGVVLSLAGYFPYLKGILSGKIKPHVFSWLIWVITTGIAFLGQIYGNAGAGAWVTGIAFFFCIVITILTLKKGKIEITKTDWISFVTAIFAIILWIITKQPLLSVLLSILIDAAGYVPTFRKSYYRPYEEATLLWFLNGLKFLLALFALTEFNLLSSIFPIYLIATNWSLFILILIRRKQIHLRTA